MLAENDEFPVSYEVVRDSFRVYLTSGSAAHCRVDAHGVMANFPSKHCAGWPCTHACLPELQGELVDRVTENVTCKKRIALPSWKGGIDRALGPESLYVVC